jgi:DNA replication and repair protein RecF
LYVSALKLVNFRNFPEAEFAFDEQRTAVCGANGRGKSNLLESVYFLAVGKSGRGARDREVLRWGAEFFSIDAQVAREDRSFAVRIAFDPRLGKKAHIGEQPLPRLSNLIGEFNAVLFSPEDVDLVLRDPSQRRRILDILVSQSSSSYLSDLEVYRRALSQRNRLLRDGGPRLLADPSQLGPWDEQLAEAGARIIRRRLEALDAVQGPIERFYSEIAPKSEVVRAEYRGIVREADRDRAHEILAEALHTRRQQEAELGYTLSGPHRDNLVFLVNGREAHQFASKGQLKTVLLAWKLAEATFLEAQTGRRPVLLMDDIFSELDRERAFSLMDLVGSFGQVVLTSARDPDLPLDAKGYCLVEL